MDILIFVLTSLGLGILCSIPGIFIGRFLAARGIVRNRSVSVIATCIGGLLLIRIMAPDFPVVYIATAFLFLSPLGAFKDDLWTTFRNGIGWWLKKEDERQRLFDLPTSLLISIAIGSVMVVLVMGILMLIKNLLP